MTGNRDPGHRVAHALGRQRQQEPAVVGVHACHRGIGHAPDDDRGHRRAGGQLRAVDLPAGDEVWKHAQRLVEPSATLGLGHADRRPRAIVTVTAHADTEDQAVTGQVLQRRHVLRDPRRFAPRHDEHTQAEPEVRGRGRGRGDDEGALQDRVARAGHELVDHPGRRETERLRVGRRAHHVGDGTTALGERRQEHADRGDGHRGRAR